MVTSPPITANKRVDFFRHNAIVTGDKTKPTAIDNDPIIPIKNETERFHQNQSQNVQIS